MEEKDSTNNTHRPTSAPSISNLFSFSLENSNLANYSSFSRYSKIFSDIRTDETYPEFFASHSSKLKLPPPLPNSSGDVDISSIIKDKNHRNTYSNPPSPIREINRTHLLHSPNMLRVNGTRSERNSPREYNDFTYEAKSPVSNISDNSSHLVHSSTSTQSSPGKSSKSLIPPAFHSNNISIINSPNQISKNETNSTSPNNFRYVTNETLQPILHHEYWNSYSNNPSEAPIPFCRFFAQGFCSKGASCNFSHTLSSEEFYKIPPTNLIPTEIQSNNIPTNGSPYTQSPSDHSEKSRPLRNQHPNTSSVKKKNQSYAQNKSNPQQAKYYPKKPYESQQHIIELISSLHSSSSPALLTGNVVTLACDQNGCRLLQSFLNLDQKESTFFNIIFPEVFDNLSFLITDQFANYLCQKILDYTNSQQRLALLKKICDKPNDFITISRNLHGTRVIQKLVEISELPEEFNLITAALKYNVVTLIKDLNGNHVIQKAVLHFNSRDRQFIYDSLAKNCVTICTHKHGCCVFQKCLDLATPFQKNQLISEILSHLIELVQDPFGNYVVQYLLSINNEMKPLNSNNEDILELRRNVIPRLLGHIIHLSVQKFSSNVIEKCLECSQSDQRKLISEELILSNNDQLARLLMDPFANYVIQKALSIAPSNEYQVYLQALRVHIINLQNNSPTGKKIYTKFIKRFPDFK